jgi:hypothetical protein
MRYVYGVFLPGNTRIVIGDQFWTRKRRAVQAAKLHGGEVRRLSRGYFEDCGGVMDAPTFYLVSERIS